MAGKITKTNALRILDSKKISYEVVPYQVNENDLSAQHVASQLNEPVEEVFKTLVIRNVKNDIFVCVIPGLAELDLKKAAKITESKSCDMIHVKELSALTGYIRGGCSPIGMKKAYPTYIHHSCSEHKTIYISAGVRGLQVKIAPNDLVQNFQITICDLIKEEDK